MSNWNEMKKFLVNRGENIGEDKKIKNKQFEVEAGEYERPPKAWDHFIWKTDIGKMIRGNENIKFGDGKLQNEGVFIKLDEENFAKVTLERSKENGTLNANVEIFERSEVEQKVIGAFYDPEQPEQDCTTRVGSLLKLKEFEMDEKKIDIKVLRTKVYYYGDVNYERITAEEFDLLLAALEEGDEAFSGRLPEGLLKYPLFEQKVLEYVEQNPNSKVAERMLKQGMQLLKTVSIGDLEKTIVAHTKSSGVIDITGKIKEPNNKEPNTEERTN